jgi:hypothetical protein
VPQCRSGCCGEEINRYFCWKSNLIRKPTANHYIDSFLLAVQKKKVRIYANLNKMKIPVPCKDIRYPELSETKTATALMSLPGQEPFEFRSTSEF